MSKKIKVNSKYANVKSQINHGKTTKDVDILSDNLVAKRKGENYGRVKCSTLARFLTEFSTTESVFDLMKSNTNGGDDFDAHNKENSDAVSQTGSVVSNCDSVVTCTTEMLGITADTKFVLLDLRDEEEYKQWHLKESINFPAPNINRDK
jgi:centrosomal protein CEP41